jgi:hypothetical protein
MFLRRVHRLAVVASDPPETEPTPPAAPAAPFPHEPGDQPAPQPVQPSPPSLPQPVRIPAEPPYDDPVSQPGVPTAAPLAARLSATDEALAEIFEARMQASRCTMAMHAMLLGLSNHADWISLALGDMRPSDTALMATSFAPLAKSLRDVLHKIDALQLASAA